MRYWWALGLLVLLGCAGCSPQTEPSKRQALATVGNRTLLMEQVPAGVLAGATGEDSVSRLRNFVESWIRQELLYQRAVTKMGGRDRDIEQQAADYAKLLYIQSYERNYELRHLDTAVQRTVIDSFYQANPAIFTLATPIVRCLVLVVEEENPHLGELRAAYRVCDDVGLQRLASLTLEAGISPRRTPEEWISLPDLVSILPASLERIDSHRRMRNIEASENGLVYLVNICEWCDMGTTAPLSYVYCDVRDIILNQRRAALLRALENETYQQGMDDGKAKVHF